MKASGVFITLLFFTIFALSVVQVVISNRLSTAGIKLGKIQDEITSVKNENTILLSQLLTQESFNHIASRASSLGFVEGSSIVFSGTLPLALK